MKAWRGAKPWPRPLPLDGPWPGPKALTGLGRVLMRTGAFLLWTAICVPVQALFLVLPGRGKAWFTTIYWSGVCVLLSLRVRVIGTPATGPFPHGADEADTSELNAIQVKERETVLELLDEHRWNVSSVAKGLGISRNTLYRKMHRLHIRLSHDGSATPWNS